MQTFKLGEIEVAAENLGQAKIAAEILQRRGVTQRKLGKVLQQEWDFWASSPHVEDQYAGTAAVESIARNLGIKSLDTEELY